MSACAIVKGTQRNLFVVPSSDTFEVEDLRSLQEEADADPSTKGQLMKKLHVSCIRTKAISWACIHRLSMSCRSCSEIVYTGKRL